jgi:hypothetical protein
MNFSTSQLLNFQLLTSAQSRNIGASEVPRPTIRFLSPRTSTLSCFVQLQAMSQSTQKRGRGQGRDVQVSKALSKLLRHAAEKEGLKMNAQGYASVTDVVRSSNPP